MFDLSDSTQMYFVFGLIFLASALMASNKLRYDTIALGAVLALIVSGVLSVQESLAGFGNSVVILIAGLLILGEMLDRTGVARAVGDWILTKGGNHEARLLVLIMISASFLGAVMSSTAVVAIFIPIIMRIANRTSINSSRLLMPMSYAALISGMLTLIATPANLVINGELQNSGYESLSFFGFSAMGLTVLALTILYMIFIGRHGLKDAQTATTTTSYGRSVLEVWEDFKLDREVISLRISSNSSLVGQHIKEAKLGTDYNIRVLGVGRPKRNDLEQTVAPASDFVLKAGDILVVVGNSQNISQLCSETSLTEHLPSQRDQQRWAWELGAITVLIHPNSRLIGHSIKDEQFRSEHQLDVFGFRRNRDAILDFEDLKLESGDSLLVVGPWQKLQKLQAQNHDFVMLEMPTDVKEVIPAHRQMPVSLFILAAMVVLSLMDVIPLVAVVIIAAMAAVGTRCLSADQAYRSIHWSSLVLVAGMLPLADALQKTGGSDAIVSWLMAFLGSSGPEVMFSLLFFLTATMTLVLSNTTSAVLVIPIAINAAQMMDVSPYPFAIAVLFGASSGFVTPVSSPVVTLVVEPGGYTFWDFVKTGGPLLIMVFLVSLFITPLLFPY